MKGDLAMNTFKESYKKMASAYNENKEMVSVDGLSIRHYPFHSADRQQMNLSAFESDDLLDRELVGETSSIRHETVSKNNDFTYPVVYPEGESTFSNGIIMTHGLNEKSWDKYLVWAAYLSEHLKRPVILFPIAYHMNRAPKSWSNPRKMKSLVQSRLRLKPKSESTFANAALSARLGAHPELFVYSGLQSYFDVCQLMKQIKSGEHSLFAANATIDVFAYSIGAFLAEILFLNNHENLFSNSRLFMFAGGPTFDSMMGTSRYIMDFPAFKSLLHLRHKRLLKKIYRQLLSSNISNLKETWDGFYAMIHQRKGRKKREKRFHQMGQSVCAVALKKDKVMPASVILKTLKGKKNDLPVRVEMVDFPYDYTHENPFPIRDEKIQLLVDKSFKVIFDKAVDFFRLPVQLPLQS